LHEILRSMAVLHSHLLPTLVRYAAERGVGAVEIAARHGIAARALREETIAIDCGTLAALCDELAIAARDPLLGLHAATAMDRGAYGLIEYVVRNAATVRHVLEQLVRFARLINAATEARFDETTGVVEERIVGEPAGLGRHGNEFAIAHQVKVVREAAGVDFPVRRAFFAHGRDSVPTELARFFGTSHIEWYAGANGVELDPALLDIPIGTSDPSLFRLLEARANELSEAIPRSDLEAVRNAIAEHLSDPTAKRIALALGTSERTLHRRLEKQGQTFHALVDDVRRALAERYLRERGRSTTDIAVALGYSDARAFARAFRRWTGTTPVEWRRSSVAETVL
jgi:AraC-like DNA-binding protein